MTNLKYNLNMDLDFIIEIKNRDNTVIAIYLKEDLPDTLRSDLRKLGEVRYSIGNGLLELTSRDSTSGIIIPISNIIAVTYKL